MIYGAKKYITTSDIDSSKTSPEEIQRSAYISLAIMQFQNMPLEDIGKMMNVSILLKPGGIEYESRINTDNL